jgi:hypothetical protein
MAAHGTNARYNEGCRGCQPCLEAHRAVQRATRRLKAYGQWQPWIDADPVRAHVRNLMAQGVPFRRTASEADVSHYTVERLLYGDSEAPPPRKIRRGTAVRILGVQPRRDLIAARVSIDGSGTRRRLQALGCMGHAQADLAARLDVQPRHLGKINRAGRVSAGLARKTEDLYDDLWNVTPVGATADRVRLAAKRFGWLPPLAWDDDLIDLPTPTLTRSWRAGSR